MSDDIKTRIALVLITRSGSRVTLRVSGPVGSLFRFSYDPVALVNQAHVDEFLQDQPLTLLGQTSHFFMGHVLQEIPYGLGHPDC